MDRLHFLNAFHTSISTLPNNVDIRIQRCPPCSSWSRTVHAEMSWDVHVFFGGREWNNWSAAADWIRFLLCNYSRKLVCTCRWKRVWPAGKSWGGAGATGGESPALSERSQPWSAAQNELPKHWTVSASGKVQQFTLKAGTNIGLIHSAPPMLRIG